MKKASLLCLFLCCVVFSGCSKNIGENEDIYKGDLVVAGVGPEISFEPEAQEGTLVLKGNYEDHTDHIFLAKGMWEKFFKEESDYLPGNVVNFKGIVEVLDGAAGNHYYSVKTIDSLKLKKYSSVGEIRELIDVYGYCEKDSDCGYFEGVCPLGCYIPVNSKYIGVVTDIVSNFSKHLRGEMCIYGCAYVDEAICENYKCKLKSSEDLNESIICSPEEKSAEICTMQYDPVCGSDSRTYGNNCLACQSETVESYVKGECKSSAFSIEGDSKYLKEVEEILKKDGAVTCDLFYTNFGRQLHALFIADRDRFYSEKDDYSDNYRRNQTYNLLLDGKAYYRSTFPDSDNIIENSSVDIKSEIASILLDLGKYPDFQMNCSGGIENENLFAIPSR